MTDEEKPVKRTKSIDELFCRSCGEPIKKEAEICPHCGVRNIVSKPSYRASHDPSLYATSVSENWYKGVLICTALWILSIALSMVITEESIGYTLIGLVMLIAWFGLPFSLYFDIQYVRANNERWNPNTILWLIGGFIWVLNILVVIVYLIRRQESMR